MEIGKVSHLARATVVGLAQVHLDHDHAIGYESLKTEWWFELNICLSN